MKVCDLLYLMRKKLNFPVACKSQDLQAIFLPKWSSLKSFHILIGDPFVVPIFRCGENVGKG